MQNFRVPILFTIFNRPEETARVFAEIRKIKPKYLYISADGPRNEEEGELCQKTRAITLAIDWDCEVKKKFEDKNLGCKMAMAGGISWFFENVPEGIILEDDCLPHPDFFKFSEEILAKYRNDEKIMMISGDNFQDGIKRGKASYYFSKIPHIWGWASWRRAWQKYDINMLDLPLFEKNGRIKEILKSKQAEDYFLNNFRKVYGKTLDTWDYQWVYSIWKNDGICILPNVNLISNIGHNERATHTNKASSKSNRKTEPIGEIVHPREVEINDEADRYTEKMFLHSETANNLKRILRKIWD